METVNILKSRNIAKICLCLRNMKKVVVTIKDECDYEQWETGKQPPLSTPVERIHNRVALKKDKVCVI